MCNVHADPEEEQYTEEDDEDQDQDLPPGEFFPVEGNYTPAP